MLNKYISKASKTGKNNAMKAFLVMGALFLVSQMLFSNFAMGQGYEPHDHSGSGDWSIAVWFGVLELPFLFLCMYFAFVTANAMKGGVFGQGMMLMSWGFLVMGVGHLNMQAEHFFDFNLFYVLLGETAGKVAWFVALVATWSLSGLGFYRIYKAATNG
ncbi:MAG: hypothetical protein ACFB10_05130 [Salibacteraceae bacterium]